MRYSKPLSEIFSVYADLGAGFQNQNNKSYINDSLNTESKADGFYVGVTPALFINMKKGFGLNFSTALFGTMNFKKGNVKALRHVIRPTFGMGYLPKRLEKSWLEYCRTICLRPGSSI